MVYTATTGVILYWIPDQPFVTHRSYHGWFDEYNSHLSIKEKHSPGYLLLRQDPEILIHNSKLLNLIICELDITSTTFSDTTILTYEI